MRGYIDAVGKMGHTFVYSVRFDVPKRGRTMTDRLLEHKLEKA